MRGFFAASVVVVFATSSAVHALTEAEKTLFVAFAEAVSDGDTAMIAAAQSQVANPPTTLETIGFYGMEDAPPASRALRGIISDLSDGGHLVGMDPDFILLDFEPIMRGEGAVSAEAQLPDMLSMLPDVEWSDDADIALGAAALNGAIAALAHAADDAIAQNDMAVLDVTLPAGDVVYYWVTTQEVAQDWHCVLLLSETMTYGLPRIEQTVVQPIDWVAFRRDTFWSVNINPDDHPSDLPLPDNSCAAPQV